MPHPWRGPLAIVFRISRSSVPCRRSDGLGNGLPVPRLSTIYLDDRQLAIRDDAKAATCSYDLSEPSAIRQLLIDNEVWRVIKDVSARSRQLRRAVSMPAMSIFFIVIIASKARLASPPPTARALRAAIAEDRVPSSNGLSLPDCPSLSGRKRPLPERRAAKLAPASHPKSMDGTCGKDFRIETSESGFGWSL